MKITILLISLLLLYGCGEVKIRHEEVSEKKLVYSGYIERIEFDNWGYPIIYFEDGKIFKLSSWGKELDIPAHKNRMMNLCHYDIFERYYENEKMQRIKKMDMCYSLEFVQ